MTRRIVQIDDMPRISDESLYALRDIVACSAKGRGVYLESDLADDLASVLRELMERRDSAESPDPIGEIESMRRIREFANEYDSERWHARMGNAIGRLSDVVGLLSEIKAEAAPPAEADPIAELEKYGGRLITGTDDGTIWMLSGGLFEVVGGSNVMPSHLRAAAARLLERVRGSKP